MGLDIHRQIQLNRQFMLLVTGLDARLLVSVVTRKVYLKAGIQFQHQC